jgi:lipoprotein
MKNRKIIMGLGMIAVMTAVATGCSQKNAATVGTEGTTTVAESTMSEEEKKLSDYKTYGMQKDPVKGIVELVKNYQYAKVNADARRMYNVFGRSDEDGLSDLQTKLSEEAKVYEEFDDTVTYVTRGYEANSYVVFISSNVKFRDIDTKAPMLTWAYVMESPKDAFYMVENDKMTEDEKKYVDEVSRSEDIIALDAQMRKDLATAVTSDIQLGTLYSIWVQNASTKDGDTEKETINAITDPAAETSDEESTVESISETSKDEADISIAETKSGN